MDIVFYFTIIVCIIFSKASRMSDTIDRLARWDSELASLSIVETNSIVELSLLANERIFPAHLIDEYSNKEILDTLIKNSSIPVAHLVEHIFKNGTKSGM